MKKPWHTQTAYRAAFVAIAVTTTLVAGERSAGALPAFARQLNTKCSTCHAPVPPRLNNLGITFKRLGFRLPDSDDEGRLIVKDKPSRSALEDFSLIGDFRGESARGEPTSFALDEVELMGGGALGKRLSYLAQVAYEDGEVMAEGFEGQLLLGTPQRNVTTRFGLIGPLIWDKFGHQRLTISQPAVAHARVPAGDFAGYRLHDAQGGVEVGVNFNALGAEGGTLRSTYLSAGVFNGLSQDEMEIGADENNDFKDVMLQALHLWGESSTLGGLWYRGTVTDIGEDRFDDRLNRWALFGNYRLPTRTDVLAAVLFGRDDTTAEIGRIRSRSWFIEGSHPLTDRTAATLRYDRFEWNRDLPDDVLRGPTVGATHQFFDSLLVTAEYLGLKRGDEERDHQFVVRAVVIY